MIFGMGQTRIYIYVILPLLHLFISRYLPYMQTELSKKYPVKKVTHIDLPRLKGGFNGIRYLSESRIIPLQIPIASLIPNKEEQCYKRRKISNKQSNKTLHHSSKSTEQVERQAIMQYFLQAFLTKHLMVDGCMAKQGHDRFYQELCYIIKYITIYMVK